MSDIQIIPLDKVDAGGRMRGSYDRPVAALAASIRDGAEAGIGHDGLRHPIEVRARGEHYMLISGLHRLRAFEALERTEIAAFVLDVDEVKARLLELEENLVRADLTVLDRAFFVQQFRETFEAEHGVVTRGGDTRSVDFKNENQKDNLSLWSEAAVERLAMSAKALQRSLRIANGLHPKVKASLSETDWADNQKALLELAGVVPAENQLAAVERLLANPTLSMREAISNDAGPTEQDVEERWFRKSLGVFGEDKPRRRRLWSTAFVRDLDTMREAAEASGFRIEPILDKDGS